jgi:hypothetical protein
MFLISQLFSHLLMQGCVSLVRCCIAFILSITPGGTQVMSRIHRIHVGITMILVANDKDTRPILCSLRPMLFKVFVGALSNNVLAEVPVSEGNIKES